MRRRLVAALVAAYTISACGTGGEAEAPETTVPAPRVETLAPTVTTESPQRALDSLLPVPTTVPARSYPEPRGVPVAAPAMIAATELPPHRDSRPNWRCDEWIPLAVEVGWPEDELSQLSYVIYRESRCDPAAHNGDDPTRRGSLGLTQVNGFWCLPSKYWPEGWLQAHGILTDCDGLYDPATSLTASYAIWQNSGWSPWGF